MAYEISKKTKKPVTESDYNSNNIIKKEEANENKSIALFEIAKIKMKSDSKEAINLIEKAISLKGNFAPYIKLYTQLLFVTNDNTCLLYTSDAADE